MHIRITTRPVFELPLTKQHVAGLIVLSQHHYDGRCKMASQQGGFLYGWNNHVVFWDEHPDDPHYMTVSATSDELQTTLKVLESIRWCERAQLIDREIATLLLNLNRDLSAALSLSSDKYGEWQTTYVPRLGVF